MPHANSDSLFPVLFGLWSILGVCAAGFFFLNANAALKRKAWPPFIVATSLLFIAFSLTMDIPLEALFLTVPAVVLIASLNLKALQFCNSCGATIVNQNPLSTPAFCSACGAKLPR